MDSTVLIAAKQEYTEQLYDILTEGMINISKELWTISKSSINPLKVFQEKLCDIPNWNKQVLTKHYKTILERKDISEEFLEKVLEAVFLSNIKILSVVKLENKKQTVNIKIPDTQNFIHNCIIQLARELYQDPHLIDDRESKNSKIELQRNSKRLLKITRESIEKTIRNMIPMKDILDKYLEANDDSSINSYENVAVEDIRDFRSPSPPPPSRSPILQQPQPQHQPQVVDDVSHPPPLEPAQQLPGSDPEVNDIFMQQPSEEQTIKVNISEPSHQIFFSDDED
jgi:hypothetical protein